MEPIILASSSPQRQEYFTMLGLPFMVIRSSVEEIIDRKNIRRSVEELAMRKALNVSRLLCGEEHHRADAAPDTALIRNFAGSMPAANLWIAAADTIITIGGEIYGKPRDREDAGKMLGILQGRTHEVITAAALLNKGKNVSDCRSVASKVTFKQMSAAEINWYLNTNEWEGAAGSYRVQGLASCFIGGISGSFTSIAGLPLAEFYDMLRDNGYPYGG